MHEMGHTAFDLADEYSDVLDVFDDREPGEANVTTITDRSRTKWRRLIDASTPLPTMKNPRCHEEDPRPSPVPPGTVGLFGGGSRARCGVYRPEYACRMRTLGDPFCRVCRQRIKSVLRRFG